VGEAPLERQPLVVDLSRPENLPGAPPRIEFLFTHGSLVFRTGTDVYKLKRPRDYGFFDYTTLEARRHFCDEELRLNRRTAPDVYLDVLPVFRDARGHSLVRPGEIVDWAVHMRQLPDEASALALLRAGRLGAAEIEAFAARLAGFYEQAAPAPANPAGLARSVEENFTQCRAFVPHLLDASTLEAVERGQRAWLAAHSARLAARPARDGHGDLRLEHVYLLEQGPVIIDCIEFADRFRLGDPALDAAFLAMDLERCGHGALAELLLARLAYESDDYDAYPLLDGYESYRATVRCKVAGLVATDAATASAAAARKAGEARAFLELARTLVERDGAGPRPRAVVAARRGGRGRHDRLGQDDAGRGARAARRAAAGQRRCHAQAPRRPAPRRARRARALRAGLHRGHAGRAAAPRRAASARRAQRDHRHDLRPRRAARPRSRARAPPRRELPARRVPRARGARTAAAARAHGRRVRRARGSAGRLARELGAGRRPGAPRAPRRRHLLSGRAWCRRGAAAAGLAALSRGTGSAGGRVKSSPREASRSARPQAACWGR